MDAQEQVQMQDDAGVAEANAQLVEQEAATTEPVTVQELGEQTVSQSEGLSDAVPLEPVADTVVADSGAAPAVAAAPLSESAKTVLAWIESMAAIAPHQSQKAFSQYLIENIASLDAFDAALEG